MGDHRGWFTAALWLAAIVFGVMAAILAPFLIVLGGLSVACFVVGTVLWARSRRSPQEDDRERHRRIANAPEMRLATTHALQLRLGVLKQQGLDILTAIEQMPPDERQNENVKQKWIADSQVWFDRIRETLEQCAPTMRTIFESMPDGVPMQYRRFTIGTPGTPPAPTDPSDPDWRRLLLAGIAVRCNNLDKLILSSTELERALTPNATQWLSEHPE